jgi:hypothetical protein
VVHIGTINTLATNEEELGLKLSKILKNSSSSLGNA